MEAGGAERSGHVGRWHPTASLPSRLDGPLPSGVRAEGDTLGFPPLTTEHSGVYICHVSNELSSRDSQVTVEVLGKHPADTGTWARVWWGQRKPTPWMGEGLACGSGRGQSAACLTHTAAAVSTGPDEAPGRQVDLVSASMLVVGAIAALLVGLLVAVVLLMARYHRRKTQQMTQK